MGHPEIENLTPFAFSAMFLSDEEGRPIVTTLVKATFDILHGGNLELAEAQTPVDATGKHHGEPAESSYRFEPEVAFVKPATDVVLIGHAHAPGTRAVHVDVAFRVGPVGKRLRITGDRTWRKRLFGMAASDPQPFERIALVYERAYGGWDRSPEDPEHHSYHAENPVGVGYRGKKAEHEEGTPLPNLEDPDQLLTSYRGKARAAGVGFTCPQWQPRARLGGTYDGEWSRTRMPLLPRDFDRRFFSAASEGLVAPGFLRGDEPVVVLGASPEGRLSFRLPGVQAPVCRLAVRDREDVSLTTNLDTVIVDLDDRKLFVLWRNFAPLQGGALDVKAIEVTAANAPERRSTALPENVVPLPARRVA